MDGTLTDTEPLWLAGETSTMAQFGYTWTSQDQHACFGKPLPIVTEYMSRRVDAARGEIDVVLMDTMESLMSEHFAWSPGSREFLCSVLDAQLPTALVSASYRRLMNVLVAAMSADLGCDPFDATIAGDEVEFGKPHPQPYLLAAAALGVDPRECIILEDSPVGVTSALASGGSVVAIEELVAHTDDAVHFRVPNLVGLTLGQVVSGIGGGVPPQAGQSAL